MVGRPLSENVKKIQKRNDVNAQYKEAIDEYLREQEKPAGVTRLGLRKIADKYPLINKTKLTSLVNGGRTLDDFNAGKRALHAPEERVLIDLIIQSADRGFPMTHKQIKKTAEAVISKRQTSTQPHKGLRKNWVFRFLENHADELNTYWSKPLATERAQALNPEAVKAWFDLVEEHIVEKGIKRHNIYGMDESGFPPANQGKQRVVGRKGTKTLHKSGSGNRENVTGIVTICADGTVLRTTIIFKGKNFLQKWGEDNVSNAS